MIVKSCFEPIPSKADVCFLCIVGYIRYAVDWKIMARATPYSNIGKKCNLCIMEKYFIICKPETCTLNKRNELASACRHANKFLIKNG